MTPDTLHRNYYGTAFHSDGSKLHSSEDAWKENQYWNDACWHRCVPQDAKGLTLLDVGAAEGNYALRFGQRGGKAIGLNFRPNGDIITDAKAECADLGQESDAPRYVQLKQLWGGDFKVIVGGFDGDGTIAPAGIEKATIVQCLNVLEYILNPQIAVESLFQHATDRVLIATDVVHHGVTGPSAIEPILRQVFLLDELLMWCPWPTVVWHHSVPCDGRQWPQAFICATRPGSSLAPVDPAEVEYDHDMTTTETQKFWENRK